MALVGPPGTPQCLPPFRAVARPRQKHSVHFTDTKSVKVSPNLFKVRKVNLKMKLSTNLDTNLPAPGAAPVSSNVSQEEDAAFMRELKRTDPARYNRLIDNMRREAYREKSNPTEPSDIRYCDNQKDGKHRLPDNVRPNAKYCDEACKQAAYRNRAA